MNELKDIVLGDIEEITFHDPVGYYTIEEQKDVQLIFEFLQSMHLSRKINTHKDGFAFLIDIKLYNGEIIEVCVLSKDVRINRHNYKPDKDYINYIREIYNTLSQKYENHTT
ncbi:hypothetical protein HNQ56_003314 [Anaerotaenia torta]|uniref:hypothetical protein n=1 Tax=Anaerotaenia torta TaxID=433293 RepID=UPI003D24A2DC